MAMAMIICGRHGSSRPPYPVTDTHETVFIIYYYYQYKYQSYKGFKSYYLHYRYQ